MKMKCLVKKGFDWSTTPPPPPTTNPLWICPRFSLNSLSLVRFTLFTLSIRSDKSDLEQWKTRLGFTQSQSRINHSLGSCGPIKQVVEWTSFRLKYINPCPAYPGYTLPLQTVWILISWLLKKPTDLDLHCLSFSIYLECSDSLYSNRACPKMWTSPVHHQLISPNSCWMRDKQWRHISDI